jgi:hypothetical protein
MKKIVLGMILCSLILVVVSSNYSRIFAEDISGDSNTKNFGKDQLTDSMCGKKLGKPIIDISWHIQNEADEGSNSFWAFDYYTRDVKVWEISTPVNGGSGTYCATVHIKGKFYAVPGQLGPGSSPGGAKINTAADEPINGSISGGRRLTIVGTLLPTPVWPTHGDVGTTNAQCDIQGNCTGNPDNWLIRYFTDGMSGSSAWYGFKFDGGSHGTWIMQCASEETDPPNNPACTGNSGNIL